MLVRTEQVMDIAKIHAINRAAFDSATEADVVDVLRSSAENVFLLSPRKTARSSVTSCFHRFSS